MTPTLIRRTVMGGDREGRLFATTLQLAQADTTESLSMMEGRAAPYGAWTTRWGFRESFARGLFDKSIKEASRSLPLLLWHDDATWPIGHATAWDSREDGLWGTWALDDSADAQRAARAARDGHMPYLSVGYQPIVSEWEMTPGEDWDLNDSTTFDKVTRLEARLVETSCVGTPAFAEAEVTLVRSAGRPARDKLAAPKLAHWRQWRHSLG